MTISHRIYAIFSSLLYFIYTMTYTLLYAIFYDYNIFNIYYDYDADLWEFSPALPISSVASPSSTAAASDRNSQKSICCWIDYVPWLLRWLLRISTSHICSGNWTRKKTHVESTCAHYPPRVRWCDHNATHCNTLQYTATHCSTLQYITASCNTL